MKKKPERIVRIGVAGFKSIHDEQRMEIRPLTILAGANSSGKSSMMQPLLLLKQTLEAPSDVGALLLNGPCVRFTSVEQVLNKYTQRQGENRFSIFLEKSDGETLETVYRGERGQGFEVDSMTWRERGKLHRLTLGMTTEQINEIPPLKDLFHFMGPRRRLWRACRDRCFLAVELGLAQESGESFRSGGPKIVPAQKYVQLLTNVIHLPGLRGNPLRTYPKTAVGATYPGTFEGYVASLIAHWQDHDKRKMRKLGELLETLELSWKVTAKSLDATQVELRVGRMPHAERGGAYDLVSIADVGFGLSQVLPVLVALVAAEPGQLVYIEQPEIHLHPKAQRKLAHALCETAKRGAILVIETHSAILLREVQTLVARRELPEKDVCLHWFQRDEEGNTKIQSATLDRKGAYGDWPVDFDEIELEAEQAYLDAVEEGEAAE